ncbi:hypothetical protein A0H76_1141 [Hepatospora eriocheir]|uniref:phosphopyruvate hydratase n=1 Tax=Hepatospora eriocheir TaxID=1081669 RepID=A0A1X0QHV5_9MICR|nr:hypothetical protein A0H76_1141 [Hepatospora eriocheir]
MLNDVANQLNLNDLEVSLNVSANNFSKIINSEFIYSFDGYIFNTDELIDYYVNLIESYKGLIFSIKDPFNENDIRGWNKFWYSFDWGPKLCLGPMRRNTRIFRFGAI